MNENQKRTEGFTCSLSPQTGRGSPLSLSPQPSPLLSLDFGGPLWWILGSFGPLYLPTQKSPLRNLQAAPCRGGRFFATVRIARPPYSGSHHHTRLARGDKFFFFFQKKIPPLRPPLTAVPVPTTGGRPAPASCRYAWPSSSAPPPPLRPPRAAAPPRRRRSSPPRSDAAAGASSSSPRHAARRRGARPYSRLAPRRSRWRSAPRPPSPSPTASATVSPLPIHLYVWTRAGWIFFLNELRWMNLVTYSLRILMYDAVDFSTNVSSFVLFKICVQIWKYLCHA